MKARLLITEKCDRNCPGCCNKSFNLSTLPVFSIGDRHNFTKIMFTGGEPLLNDKKTFSIVQQFRLHYPDVQLILYTAKVNSLNSFLQAILTFDGITLTLHEESDVDDFNEIMDFIVKSDFWYEQFKKKSMRLNIFKNIDFKKLVDTYLWKVKKDIEWIENCPLPEGEVFMRLEDCD